MVTLRDIAEKAGVSVYTVSCALRGQQQVSLKTRERLQALAQEMGYQPHAAAAALATLRQTSRSPERRLLLAYISHQEHYDHLWRKAFQAACDEQGFECLFTEIGDYQNLAIMSKTLWNRGVSGLYLTREAAIRLNGTSGFDWSKFSVVKFSASGPDLKFHMVRHSAFGYAEMALQKCYEKGACKLAVLLVPSSVTEDDDARLGAILNWKQVHLKPGQSLHWCRKTFPGRGETWLREWLDKVRPDHVLAFPWTWFYRLREVGYRVPEDFKVSAILAAKSVNDQFQIAGCDESIKESAIKVVSLLGRMISIGEKGMAEHPMEIVNPPVWLEPQQTGQTRVP